MSNKGLVGGVVLGGVLLATVVGGFMCSKKYRLVMLALCTT